MSRNLGRLPSLAAVKTLVGRRWELGSGSRGRTSGHPQSSHVRRACEARQGTIILGRCHQDQKTQMTGDQPVGTGSISLLCRGLRCDKRGMHTGRQTEVCLAGDDIVWWWWTAAGCGAVGVVGPSPVRLT